MRILLVAHALPPDTYGGTELYTERLAEAFAADHEVTVAAPSDRGAAAADVPGASVVGLPTPTTQPEDGVALDPSAGVAQSSVDAAFADLLSTFDPDVAHFQHLKGLSSRLPRICASEGVPSVLTLHDFWTACHREQLTHPDGSLCSGPTCVGKCANCYANAVGEAVADAADGGEGDDDSPPEAGEGDATFPAFAEPVARRTARLDDALDAADLLVSPSAFLRDRFVEFGVPPGDIVQARNGIWVDAFRDGGYDPDSTLAFGYAGRLVEEKGVHRLLAAFAGVEGDARLDVYGRFDPEGNDYHARLADAAADDRVRFHGYYDDPATPFAESDVFVLPSTWYENSPLVIQEAFAAGTPVVTADRGGMAELVTHGVDGFTFDPESVESLRARLRTLASNPRLVARLREGVEPPKRLSAHAGELLDLYAGLSGAAESTAEAGDGHPVGVFDS
ncbi:glycosyltransferase family 4 protein [Halopelagius fulvigenes]|uniref:Glycosyltransferase family 4 protein n=1 Tax=Halopelagius fulvigenes TaxID=1198324 RepID=A0ABD5TVZ5_9EURY